MGVEGCTKCIKYLLFVFNFIFWVSPAAGEGGGGCQGGCGAARLGSARLFLAGFFPFLPPPVRRPAWCWGFFWGVGEVEGGGHVYPLLFFFF